MTPALREALDRLRTWRVWHKGHSIVLAHAIDGDAITPDEARQFDADLALLTAAVEAVANYGELPKDRAHPFWSTQLPETCPDEDVVRFVQGLYTSLPDLAPMGWAEAMRLLAAAADAGARARMEAIEECAQWLADRAKDHERIAIDRIAADRTDEIALTHKSMSDTYHYAAQNIRAQLAPDPSRAPGEAACWLIERTDGPRPRWLAWRDRDAISWTPDAHEADRYDWWMPASRDARLIAATQGVACVAVEHMFVASRAPGGA